MDDSGLIRIVELWMVVVGLMALARARQGAATSGLVLAYVFDLWLIHCLPAAAYLLPAFRGGERAMTEAGAEQSLYGIAGFAFGSLVIAPLFFIPASKVKESAPDLRLPFAYVITGIVFYFLLTTGLGSLPSATAIISTGQQLVVVGVSLCCWQALHDKQRRNFFLWLGVALSFPLITIVTRGFIGYGAAATLCVLIFLTSFVKSRFLVAAGGLLFLYLGLTVFVSYMRDRGEIRASVWGGQSLGNRVGVMGDTVSTFEWFDPSDPAHLERIDGRLNQDMLVGAAVLRMSETGSDFARGETLWDSFLALIPRALWKDKPMEAGSGTMVTEYTGIQFAKGTSVGVGQVMEFYINFGTKGVVICFMLMGILITYLDYTSAQRLKKRDLHGFVLYYLPGISLLQVGGSMMEVTTSTVASFIVAAIANRYLDRLQDKESKVAEVVAPATMRRAPVRT